MAGFGYWINAMAPDIVPAMAQYEKWRAWQACHQLVLVVYQVSGVWPRHEQYSLVAQLRRAAFSAAANIAEGSARHGRREFSRYLVISIGSLVEVEYCLRLARDLGYLTEESHAEAHGVLVDATRLTRALQKAIRAA